MSEEDTLDDIFNVGKKWKGKFRLWFCDLCDTFSIGCPAKCTSQKAKKVAELLYKDSSISLDRKKEKIENYLTFLENKSNI